jgi:hypothetical protein
MEKIGAKYLSQMLEEGKSYLWIEEVKPLDIMDARYAYG